MSLLGLAVLVLRPEVPRPGPDVLMFRPGLDAVRLVWDMFRLRVFHPGHLCATQYVAGNGGGGARQGVGVGAKEVREQGLHGGGGRVVLEGGGD